MSRVEFKILQCRMSLSYPCPMLPLRGSHVPCRIQEMPFVVSLFFSGHVDKPHMSRVDFKIRSCRPVDFRGLGP